MAGIAKTQQALLEVCMKDVVMAIAGQSVTEKNADKDFALIMYNEARKRPAATAAIHHLPLSGLKKSAFKRKSPISDDSMEKRRKSAIGQLRRRFFADDSTALPSSLLSLARTPGNRKIKNDRTTTFGKKRFTIAVIFK
jgi:hypothetical protein